MMIANIWVFLNQQNMLHEAIVEPLPKLIEIDLFKSLSAETNLTTKWLNKGRLRHLYNIEEEKSFSWVYESITWLSLFQ